MTTHQKPKFTLLLLLTAAASLLPGFTTGNFSGDVVVQMYMQIHNITYTQAQAKLVPLETMLNSAVLIGSISISLVFSFISKSIGFKKTAIIGSSGSIITVILQCIPVSEYLMLIGRILQGFFMTMFMIATLIILGEYTDPHKRGFMTYFFQVMFTVGILVATIVFYIIKVVNVNIWYISFITTLPWPIIGLIILFKIPEFEKKEKEIKYYQIFNKKYIKVLVPCLLLGTLQQSTGINAVIGYASETFNVIFGDYKLAAVYGSLVINSINFVSPLFGLVLIEKYGRKALLFTGTGLCIVGQLLLLLTYTLPKENTFLLITGAIIFIFGFEIGPGPIYYVFSAELFPDIAKSTLVSIFFLFNYIPNIFVIVLFPILTAYARYIPFLSYIIAMSIFSGMLIFVLPDTTGKTNKEIEELMIGKSSKVENIEPLISYLTFVVLAMLLSIVIVMSQMPDVFV
ncbi:Sugar transporter family protein [Spironucleus salmonicida]|uniref:Sugar (And other) transporter family protein n=1 Tax=Spironucleus salmonicida TaxID=348837 RepID=V6LAL4_9EUKA|nr:Sugar transporter family protein [Spironucleus salmonicida]|eukprot:EST41452.1 Sugar (and other) transporter family protein [Spironucleus salmonicida]